MVTSTATLATAGLATHIELTNLAMVYLLGVTIVALRGTPRAAVIASLLSVATFDFVFVPPSGTFAVSDVEYLFTLAVMLSVGLLISGLRIQLVERVEAWRTEALRAERESVRGDLLSAVSHDLRTPLSSIEGSADALLAQHGISHQSAQLATTIREEAQRMAKLIENLLDMTRVRGRLDLRLDWHGLDELLTNAILRTESQFQTPVRIQHVGNVPILRVDGVLLEQVFVNILENASHHAGRSSLVKITTECREKTCMITFTDTGPGFTAGTEEHVFERWFGSSKGGFGLGLAICQSAVEAHGGKVEAGNRPTGGAFVRISLPMEVAVG